MPHEIERYELAEAPAYQFAPTRRDFVEILGAGLLLTVFAPETDAQTSATAGRLILGEDGTVTVLSGKVEVGQGSRTQLAMAAAEELGLPLEQIRVVLADTDLVPNDGITAGSRTTPSTVPAVRRAAAAARQMLEASGKKTYAELARTPGWNQDLPEGATVRPVKDWKLLGQSRPHVHARSIVTGAHRFPSDIVLPGMLYGAVLRAPAYKATLAEVDLTAAKAGPGVVAVHDAAFVGVAAPTSYQARQALAAITARWQREEHVNSTGVYAHLKKTGRNPRAQERGTPQTGTHQRKAEYRVPYIQHAPMEPRAAVAHWEDGKLTVWTGTQNPHGVRDQLAQAFQLPASKVRVIVPDSGGGFGGKHTGEVAIEAARLAREARRPVKLRWTREEEFRWAYFRPAGYYELDGAVDSAGHIVAWNFDCYNAGMAGLESPYRLPHSRTRFYVCDSPLREGSYRGIAATANNFARECFMDELAAAASLDPLEFRLRNLEDPRLRAVLEAAAKRFNWTSRGKAKGLAAGVEKGSYVAACAEIELGAGRPRVKHMVMAYECGAIQNPLNLRSQVEGSLIQGLGAALTEAMVFDNGELRNGRFAQYPVPRFRDVPPFDIVLLDRPDLPSVGAGETPIIAVAPAIANAVRAATGSAARDLPLRTA